MGLTLSVTIEDADRREALHDTLEPLTTALSDQHGVELRASGDRLVVDIDEDPDTAGLIQQQLDRQLKQLGLPIVWDR